MSINDQPIEILLHIIMYLNYSTHFKLRSVCKTLKNLIDSEKISGIKSNNIYECILDDNVYHLKDYIHDAEYIYAIDLDINSTNLNVLWKPMPFSTTLENPDLAPTDNLNTFLQPKLFSSDFLVRQKIALENPRLAPTSKAKYRIVEITNFTNIIDKITIFDLFFSKGSPFENNSKIYSSIYINTRRGEFYDCLKFIIKQIIIVADLNTLIKFNSKINFWEKKLDFILSCAAIFNRQNIIEYSFDNYEDLYLDYSNILNDAISNNNIECAELILTKNKYINCDMLLSRYFYSNTLCHRLKSIYRSTIMIDIFKNSLWKLFSECLNKNDTNNVKIIILIEPLFVNYVTENILSELINLKYYQMVEILIDYGVQSSYIDSAYVKNKIINETQRINLFRKKIHISIMKNDIVNVNDILTEYPNFINDISDKLLLNLIHLKSFDMINTLVKRGASLKNIKNIYNKHKTLYLIFDKYGPMIFMIGIWLIFILISLALFSSTKN